MALEWINSVSSEGEDKFSGASILLLHSPSPDLAKCALGEDAELSSLSSHGASGERHGSAWLPAAYQMTLSAPFALTYVTVHLSEDLCPLCLPKSPALPGTACWEYVWGVLHPSC